MLDHSIFSNNIMVRFRVILLYVFSEQQKINSGYFLFEAEQKAKKAKKDMAGKHQLHKPKQFEKSIDEQDIIVVDSSDDTTVTDESVNS